jgi:hypothetical protein
MVLPWQGESGRKELSKGLRVAVAGEECRLIAAWRNIFARSVVLFVLKFDP